MLQERLLAARSIVTELHDAERRGSAALRGATKFMDTMLDARDTIELGPVFGQDALDHTAAALLSFTEGMRHMRNAHIALKGHRVEAGLSAYALGDESFTPTGVMKPADRDDLPERHLQAVS